MEKIISLCKRRGFIFQGSEIYGGLAGTWDYGPMGFLLRENIKKIWRESFVDNTRNVYPMDAAIIMNPKAWEASGHVSGFSDPLVECKKCKRRFRADQVEGDCPECGGAFGEVRQFNMMFETKVGATEDATSTTYLRPETAGGMFVNYKNVMGSIHPKLPFGLAQIGKAFRNEIAPRDFLFRSREFEQMEVEYFVRPTEWESAFEEWRERIWQYIRDVGIDEAKVSELEVPAEDRAHYSKRTIDFEFEWPFGKKELYGLAYRTDFDLSAHAQMSGADLSYLDDETGERFVPHVIEPSLGVDRTVLAVLASAYKEDTLGDDTRVYLKLDPKVAPFKAAVFPLLRNKPELVKKAQEVLGQVTKAHRWIAWDDNGNIGKRYRRQDEIGTPYCITIDFETLENDTVTVRDRDTGEQERLNITELNNKLLSAISK